ncbi:MAG: ABC transporter ATP-binding protein [Candidatus Hecatellales archaeon]|nr:MAG: ABC transporter ATP-binding protein [Candidatus Hecatellales archaeon]
MSTILKAVDVVAGYGKLVVVHKVTVELKKNEIVVIVGPNGSGKSTLIKSILGFSKLFDGKILYENQDITGLRTDRLIRMGIGYVPQINNVFTNLTVEENLEIGAYPKKDKNEVKASISEVYDMFPVLRQKKNERAGNLSGGERQILALGRVMVLKPKILLFDEPTASLSPIAASQVLSYIREICDSGISVLMAEQNARKGLAVSDRGYILVDGRCVKEGSSKEILEDKEIGKLYLGLKA